MIEGVYFIRVVMANVGRVIMARLFVGFVAVPRTLVIAVRCDTYVTLLTWGDEYEFVNILPFDDGNEALERTMGQILGWRFKIDYFPLSDLIRRIYGT